jgi:hypothetical protein
MIDGNFLADPKDPVRPGPCPVKPECTTRNGTFVYIPMPWAAFGNLVVLNNPPNNNYTVHAILPDKPGYKTKVNSSWLLEIHRRIAAMTSTPSSMPDGIRNIRNGNVWGNMKPLEKSRMYTL